MRMRMRKWLADKERKTERIGQSPFPTPITLEPTFTTHLDGLV